eukprot:jgi/Botrbrau1/7448/Bobra.0083s0019.1
MVVREIKLEKDWDETLSSSKASGKLVLVDFSAEWCGPCKMISPVFEELSEQYPDFIFLKVDVDCLSAVAVRAEISAMPTFQVYQDGAMVEQLVGASKERLGSLVLKYAVLDPNKKPVAV